MAKKELFDNIDDLLGEVEQSSKASKTIEEIDGLCDEINAGVDKRKNAVERWPEDRKHKEAADSKDPFVVNLLSMDKSFPVRTLAACNPLIPTGAMRRLAEESDYMRMVVAHNINCPPEVLDRISDLSNEKEVLDAAGTNKNASEALRFKTGHLKTADLTDQLDPVEEPVPPSDKSTNSDQLDQVEEVAFPADKSELDKLLEMEP
jgi:hypothetical protein